MGAAARLPPRDSRSTLRGFMPDAADGPRVVYIDDQQSFDAVAPILRDAPVLAIDTESDSLYRYQERVCFVQIGALGRAFLVDSLAVRDLSALADACADPKKLKVLHGADYDVACLKRDFGVVFENLFDTMIASQLIGREQLGLAALVREFFEVELDKTLTTHDWGRRPLESKYLRYLADDVLFLEEIRSRLERELIDADVFEEARIEFRRVSKIAPSRGVFDPEGFRRIKGARDLDRVGLSALRELYFLRDRVAREENRPPFKVLSNQSMIDAARFRPREMRDLRRVQGFSDYVLRRLGEPVLDAIRAGIDGADAVPLRLKPTGPRPSEERLAREDALKAWRRETAEREGRTTMAVLPNHLLGRIADEPPRDVEGLAALEDFGASRVRRYGDDLLRLLAAPPPPADDRRRRPHRRRSDAAGE
jgi:ribonuclease D